MFSCTFFSVSWLPCLSSGYYTYTLLWGRGRGTEFWELESCTTFDSLVSRLMQCKKSDIWSTTSSIHQVYFMLFFSGFFLVLVSVKINISVNQDSAKHFKLCQKYSARHWVSILFSVFGKCGQKWSFEFHMLQHNLKMRPFAPFHRILSEGIFTRFHFLRSPLRCPTAANFQSFYDNFLGI